MDNKLELLIKVLDLIQQEYGSDDFLYPQSDDETSIDFAFRNEPESYVLGAIVEDLSDLGLMVMNSNKWQDDTPFVNGYILSFTLRSDWLETFDIPAESWAYEKLQNNL